MPTATDLKRRIYSLRDLPTLPVVARKIMSAVGEDNSHRSLADIVSRDQALAAKVLGLANSAYYGHRATVRTLSHAIAIIGTVMLKQLSLSVFVIQAWGSRSNPERTRFWKHSIAAAHAASAIARMTRSTPPDEAFCAGLLHDIGALVLEMCFPEQYEEVRRLVEDADVPLFDAEKQLLGIDHCQAGAWLAEGWQMPEPLINAIANHHGTASDSEDSGELAGMVRIADLAATNVGMGLAGESMAGEPVVEALGFSESQYLQVIEELESSREDIEAFFNLV